MSLFSNSAMLVYSKIVTLIQQVVYNYTPTWESYFSRNVDVNGWSNLTPSSDSKLIYLDVDNGDDGTASPHTIMTIGGGTWDNPNTMVSAYKTRAAALAEMREGFPDYLIIKKGTVLPHAGGMVIPAGRSATERSVIGAYGTGARPFINASGDSVSITNFTAVIGLEITDTQRIPEHPDFIGFDNIDDGRGVYCYGGSENLRQGNLIEGNYIHHKGINISNVGDDFDNIIIRRNVLAYSFKNRGGRHPQGIWGEKGRFLIEENAFINNGFLIPTLGYPTYNLLADVSGTAVTELKMDSPIDPATASSGFLTAGNYKDGSEIHYTSYSGDTFYIDQTDFSLDPLVTTNIVTPNKFLLPTIFSHSFYLAGIYESIVRKNLSYKPSSIHFKFTSNPNGMNLAVNLTNANESEVVVDSPIDPRVQQEGVLTLLLDDNVTQRDVKYTSYSGSAFQVVADENVGDTDFSVNTASIGQKVQANYIISHKLAIYQNGLIDGEVGVSIGGNEKDPSQGNYVDSNGNPRWENCYAQGNILDLFNYGHANERGLAWGIFLTDQKNSVVSDNLFLPTLNPSLTSVQAIDVNQYQEGIEVFNNTSLDAGGIDRVLGEAAFSSLAYSNYDTAIAGDFVDGSRNAIGYAGGTINAFRDGLLNKQIDNWNTSFTFDDYSNYIKGGLTLITPMVAYSQPTTVNVIEGSNLESYFGVAANTRTTYQWYWASNNSEIVGATNAVLDIIANLSDDGKQVYCIASDELGNTLQSDNMTLVISAGVVNKLADSDDLTTVNWYTNRASIAEIIDTDTGLTAFQLTGNGDTNQRQVIAQNVPMTSAPEAFQAKFKAVNGWQYAGINIELNGTKRILAFDIVNGLITKSVGFVDAAITDLGDGWWLCEGHLSPTGARTTAYVEFILLSDPDGINSTVTSASESFLIRDPMVEDGTDVSDYVV